MAGMQREIGIIIKVKDAAAAKQAIKDIVDKQILEHIKKLNLQLKETGDSVDKLGRKAKEVEPTMDSFFKGMIKGTGILYTLKKSMGFALDSFEKGAGLERAANQFESSIGKIGDVLPQLRAATRGTVEDMKLLETANRAVMEGLNPRQLTKMYQMATVASRKLGLGTEQSIQTISNAIVRQDESALTTLGTILKTNIGLKVQNALIAKNGGVMSGAMALAVRQSVIMSELNAKFGGFNKLQEDSVEVLEKFRASMSNLKMAVGQTIGTALAPLLKVLTSLGNAAVDFLNSVKDTAGFKTFIQYLGTLGAFFIGKGFISSLLKTTKYLGFFVGGLKAAAVIAGGTIAFKALGLDVKDLSAFFEKANTVASVFFQLLNNYDSESGLSSVLTKDKEALGGLYDVVFTLVKGWMLFKAVATGAFEGVKLMLSIVKPLLGSFGDALMNVIEALGSNQPIFQSTLDRFERLGVVVGVAGTALAGLWVTQKAMAAVGVLLPGLNALLWIYKQIGRQAFIQLGIETALAVLRNNWVGVAAVAGLGVGAAYGLGAFDGLGNSNTSPNKEPQTGAIDPGIREQNMQAVYGGNDSGDKALKLLSRIADSNDRVDARDEQRQVKESTSNPFGNIRDK